MTGWLDEGFAVEGETTTAAARGLTR
jgi:hypothetical protein